MCVYNGRRVSLAEFIRLKEMEAALQSMEGEGELAQSGYDYRSWPILKPKGTTGFEIVMAHWEFLPKIVPDSPFLFAFREQYNTLNAKAETLLTSSLYREAALNSRCLVLSTGFYEYRQLPQLGKKGQILKAAKKIPYHITLPDTSYFFMAGISQLAMDGESGELVDSFSIVTTTANALLEKVHNVKKRMPTILPEALAYEWLFGILSEARIMELAAYQFPAEKMKAYSVHKDFSASDNPSQSFIHDDVPELQL